MISKIIKIIILILNLQFVNLIANANIYIEVKIEDEVITNYDIKKEIEYLKLLNPNLQNLNINQIYPLGKNSLISEIIKKKEINKIFDLEKDNPIIDNIYENLLQKVGAINENELNNILLEKKSYTPKEIKEKLKIEIYWNDLIFLKYKNQINVDVNQLKKKINNRKDNLKTEYSLSEIVFKNQINKKLEIQIEQIKESIKIIGFNNTANIYSISESSKYGGKVGWIDEKSLSTSIIEKIKNLEIGEITEVIKIGNNFLIIKIDDKKTSEIKIDKDVELKKMIEFERNQQLSLFSKIYFDKSKMNYSINEN